MAYGSIQQVKELTGVTYEKLALNDEAELDNVLTTWLNWIAWEIDNRLKENIDPTDERYNGIEAVAVRFTGKIVNHAIANRTAHTVSLNETKALNYPDMNEIISGLDEELKPYKIKSFYFGIFVV